MLSWCNSEPVVSAVSQVRGLGSDRSFSYEYVRLGIRVGDGERFSQQLVIVDPATVPFCFLLGADCLTVHDLRLDFRLMSCSQCDESTNFNNISAEDIPRSFLLSCQSSGAIREIHVGRSCYSLAFRVDCDDSGEVARLTQLIEYDQLRRLQKHDSLL